MATEGLLYLARHHLELVETAREVKGRRNIPGPLKGVYDAACAAADDLQDLSEVPYYMMTASLAMLAAEVKFQPHKEEVGEAIENIFGIDQVLDPMPEMFRSILNKFGVPEMFGAALLPPTKEGGHCCQEQSVLLVEELMLQLGRFAAIAQLADLRLSFNASLSKQCRRRIAMLKTFAALMQLERQVLVRE